MGASVPETGSHPTGQAELHRLDASRFDPARGLPQTLAKCSRCGAPPYVELFPNGEGPTIPLWICAHHKMFGGECPSDTAYLSEDAWQEAAEKQAFQLLADRASTEPQEGLGHPASVPNADDVRLLSAGPDPRGGFTFSFGDSNPGGVIHLIAAHLYEMMGCGTPHELNCVQMDVKPRDFAQAFTLTLQRDGGKSPLRLKAEAKGLLIDALTAIESGRREPLEIMRDRIRNWIEADPASAIEAGTATTTEIGVVHESAASEAGDAQ